MTPVAVGDEAFTRTKCRPLACRSPGTNTFLFWGGSACVRAPTCFVLLLLLCTYYLKQRPAKHGLRRAPSFAEWEGGGGVSGKQEDVGAG